MELEVKNVPEGTLVEKISNIENIRNIDIITGTPLSSSNSSSVVEIFECETAADDHETFKELIEKKKDVKQIILLENNESTISGDRPSLQNCINTLEKDQEQVHLKLNDMAGAGNEINLKFIDREMVNTVDTYDTSCTYFDELNALLDTTSDSDISCSTTSSVPISTSSPLSGSPDIMESGSSSSLSLCTEIPNTFQSSSFQFIDANILKDEQNIYFREIEVDDDNRNFDFLFSDRNISESHVGNSTGEKGRMLCDIRMDESEDRRCLLLDSFSDTINNLSKNKKANESEICTRKEEIFTNPIEKKEMINLTEKKHFSSPNLISVDLFAVEKKILQLPEDSIKSLTFMDMDIEEVENEIERGSEKALVRRRDVLSPEKHIFGKKSKVEKQGSGGESGDITVSKNSLDEAETSSDVTEMEATEVKNLFSEDLGSDSKDNMKVLINDKIIPCDDNIEICIFVDQHLQNVGEISEIVSTEDPDLDFQTESKWTKISKTLLCNTSSDEEWEKRAFARLTVRNEIAKWKYLWEIASYEAANVSRERSLKKI